MFEVLATRIVRSMSGSPVRGVDELGEVGEHLGHLVAPLAAADIDDDVGRRTNFARVCCDDGLARCRTRRGWRRCRRGGGEEGVQDALPGDEGPRGRASGAPAGASAGHSCSQREHAAVLEHGRGVVDGQSPARTSCDRAADCPAAPACGAAPGGLLHGADHVAGADGIAGLTRARTSSASSCPGRRRKGPCR